MALPGTNIQIALRPQSIFSFQNDCYCFRTSIMSQVWRVIAPERKEATGALGELIDAVLCQSAAGIVPLLAVPLNVHRFVFEQL